jgi:multidrug efflux pump
VLSERAIDYPRIVLLAAVAACSIGAAAIFTLPKERTPRVKLPVIVVATPNAGAEPATNERRIVRQIEREAGRLKDLKDRGGVQSQSVHGAAVVQFVFNHDVSVDDAKRDVESLINSVKGEFPDLAQKDPGPQVNDIAFEDWPIIQVYVAGGTDGRHRRRVADRLTERIEKIAGVAGVDVFGGMEREVHIEVDPHLMTLYGFTFEQLRQAVSLANSDAPTGVIKTSGGGEQRVRAETKLASLDAIRRVPLGVRRGRPILLSDVAEVGMGHEPRTSLARYDGQDAVVLLVRARTDIDVMDAARGIERLVDGFVAAGLAEGTAVGTGRSQAREIWYMLDQLLTSAGYGTILVFILLLLFLGWRNAVLIGTSVPFAILVTAAMMWFSKKSIFPDLAINNMTLFAMILVIGMVVDGCIIVGENIFRHRQAGMPAVAAAKRGIGEVGTSLVTAYLTTFAAFAPMYMIRGVMGDFMELLPTVVLFSLCSAMLVDHFLLPVLSVAFMKPPGTAGGRRSVAHAQTQISTDAALQTHAPTSRVLLLYGRMLRYTLHHRLLVLALSACVALTPAWLFYTGAIGFEFFPDSDVPVVEVHFELPLGSGLEQRTSDIASRIEASLRSSVLEHEWYKAGPGTPRMGPMTTLGEPGALNIRMDTESAAGPEFGMIYVELELAENRSRSAAEIRRAIVEGLPDLPGVIVRVKSPEEGPPTGAPILVRVLGREDTPLERLAERARTIQKLLRQTPGVYDVVRDHRLRPQIRVRPNRVVASLYGVSAELINANLNYALNGVRVGDVDFEGNEKIDLRIRNRAPWRDQITDLLDLPIRTDGGAIVSLDQVAEIDRIESPNVIHHYESKRVINVRAQLEPGALTDEVKARLVAALRPDLDAGAQRRLVMREDVILADGDVSVEFGGETEIRDDALTDLNIALAVAAAAMLIILVIKFNSFVQPLIILFSVPLSLVGVSIGLMICGLMFSVSAMIGVVALSGIVVNDAIVLVDFINRLRREGAPLEEAVIRAGQLRLRPIFLTTITTIGGLLPLALNLAGGGEFWQPLTVTIMFGLGFATLQQLFVIPLACFSVEGWGKGT